MPRRLLPRAHPAVGVGRHSLLPLRFSVGAEDPSPVLPSFLTAGPAEALAWPSAAIGPCQKCVTALP